MAEFKGSVFGCDKLVENIKKCPFEAINSEVDCHGNSVYFLKQTIFNACGTIALIHALANNISEIGLDPESVIGKFIDETQKMTVEERSHYLKQNKAINEAHEATAWEGEERPSWLNDSVCCHHYITLLQSDSKLYQLDGLKEYPVSHGHTSGETFLSDAAEICSEYIKQDPSNIKFNAMALVKVS
nr:ubiquitin carboxyl-terminal hydrolase isozyme L3-like [Parasteatoda tepidariorum]